MHLSKGPSVRRWSGTGSYSDLRDKVEQTMGAILASPGKARFFR